jgi:hypothetical protein
VSSDFSGDYYPRRKNDARHKTALDKCGTRHDIVKDLDEMCCYKGAVIAANKQVRYQGSQGGITQAFHQGARGWVAERGVRRRIKFAIEVAGQSG